MCVCVREREKERKRERERERKKEGKREGFEEDKMTSHTMTFPPLFASPGLDASTSQFHTS